MPLSLGKNLTHRYIVNTMHRKHSLPRERSYPIASHKTILLPIGGEDGPRTSGLFVSDVGTDYHLQGSTARALPLHDRRRTPGVDPGVPTSGRSTGRDRCTVLAVWREQLRITDCNTPPLPHHELLETSPSHRGSDPSHM
jgi:hypothetical protein